MHASLVHIFVSTVLSCSLCQSILSLSTRVSNQLGAGQPRLARLAVGVSLCIVVTEGIVVGAILILGRKVWGYCYSSEQEVVSYVGQMLILVAVSHFFDGLQAVLSGSIFPILLNYFSHKDIDSVFIRIFQF